MKRLLQASIVGALASIGLVQAGQDAPHPLASAHAGQWVMLRYTTASGDDVKTVHSYQWVDRVADRKVYLKTQSLEPERKLGLWRAVETVVDLDKQVPDIPKDAKASAVCEEELTVGDKAIRCKKTTVIIEQETFGKMTTITWTSDEVPLFGIVKRVTLDKDGKEIARTLLLAYGEEGGAEKPLADKSEPGRD